MNKRNITSYCLTSNLESYNSLVTDLRSINIHNTKNFIVNNSFIPRMIKRRGVSLDHSKKLDSHIRLLKLLNNQEKGYYLIVEEDITIHQKIDIEEIVNSSPDFDILYLGGVNHYHKPYAVNDFFYKCRFSFASHAYIVKSSFIPNLIDEYEKRTSEIEVMSAYMQQNNVGSWYGTIHNIITKNNSIYQNYKLKDLDPQNFVWILKDNSDNNMEIKYSIRSVLKYHPNATITIIGGKPNWYLGNHHYIADKNKCPYVNAWEKIEYACTLFDTFIYMDDDFYLMQPFEQKHYYNKTMLCNLEEHNIKDSTENNQWSKVLIASKKAMPESALMHCMHIPLPIISKNFLEISKEYPQRLEAPSLVPRQIYCHNETNFRPYHFMGDLKFLALREVPKSFFDIDGNKTKNTPFFSIGDQIDEFIPLLENLYPKRSPLEELNIFGCDVEWWCFDRIATKMKSYLDLDITKVYSTEVNLFMNDINWVHAFNWRIITKVKNANVISMGIYDHRSWKEQKDLFKIAVEKVDFICASSSFIKEDLQNHGITKPIYIITDGVDFELFKRHEINNGKIQYLWAGRTKIWNAVKRVDVIEECMRDLKIERFNIQNYDIEKIPHHEMPNLYANNDVLICYSITEGTPNTVLEAAASGRFIITTEVGVVKELQHIIDGIIVVKSRDDLKNAIKFCEENAEKIRKLGYENAKQIRDSGIYEWENITNDLFNIYKGFKEKKS